MTALVARPANFGSAPGLRHMFSLQATAELRRHLRAPDFAMASIALPMFFYLIVGMARASEPVPGGGTVGGYLLVVFGIFGVLSVALSGIGHTIADERARGDLRHRRRLAARAHGRHAAHDTARARDPCRPRAALRPRA